MEIDVAENSASASRLETTERDRVRRCRTAAFFVVVVVIENRRFDATGARRKVWRLRRICIVVVVVQRQDQRFAVEALVSSGAWRHVDVVIGGNFVDAIRFDRIERPSAMSNGRRQILFQRRFRDVNKKAFQFLTTRRQIVDHCFGRDLALLGSDGKSTVAFEFARLFAYDIELLQLHSGFVCFVCLFVGLLFSWFVVPWIVFGRSGDK